VNLLVKCPYCGDEYDLLENFGPDFENLGKGQSLLSSISLYFSSPFRDFENLWTNLWKNDPKIECQSCSRNFILEDGINALKAAKQQRRRETEQRRRAKKQRRRETQQRRRAKKEDFFSSRRNQGIFAFIAVIVSILTLIYSMYKN